MASIRTHNNRRRSKARSPRQRQIGREKGYVRYYRRMHGRLHGCSKDGGTITGRIPRDPEPQFPRYSTLLSERLKTPVSPMVDYGDVERRVLAHTFQGRPEVLDTLDCKVGIYDELSERLKISRVDVKDNLIGMMYGMSPGKAAQNKVKKNG